MKDGEKLLLAVAVAWILFREKKTPTVNLTAKRDLSFAEVQLVNLQRTGRGETPLDLTVPWQIDGDGNISGGTID